MDSVHVTRVPVAAAQPRSLARSLRATRRLATFALARLRRRRAMSVLSASGAALSVAMLTAVLVVAAGVEDASFTASISMHVIGGVGQFQRSNGLYVYAPIEKGAPADRRSVSARLHRGGITFQASAFVATSPEQIAVMTNDLASNFLLLSGRFPGRCTRTRCEYVQNDPGRGALGVIPVGSPFEVPDFPGYHFVKVGRVHQRPGSVLLFPPQPVTIVKGFSLITTATARSGNGALLWGAPIGSIARHPWDVGHAVRVATRLESDLKRRFGAAAMVESSSADLEAARAQAASDGRRLLIVSGAVLGVFVAFMLFVASRLRHDAELLRERLAVVNATRRQIRAVSVFEFLLAGLVGTGAGVICGFVGGALLVHQLGGDGTAAARHVLGLGSTWLYVVAALTLSICALVLVSQIARGGGRSRVPELAAAVALAALVTGAARGGLDASGLGGASRATVAFVVLVPTLVAIVIAVGGARLLAPVFVVLERASRGLAPPTRLAALSIARRPGDAGALVAFLAAALGLALFLHVYRSTLVRSQHDQVLYAAPSDALISEDLRQLVPVNSIPMSQFPGRERIRVLRASGSVPQLASGGAFTLLGVPATALPGLAGWRGDFSRLSITQIEHQLRPGIDPHFRAVPLPRRSRISLPVRSDGEPVDVAATLLSPSGTFTEVDLGDTGGRSLELTLPAGFQGGSLVGLVFRPTDTGPESSGQIGGFFDNVSVGSLRIGPVPWIDFSGFEGVDGIDAQASGHTVRIRYAVGTKEVARLRAKQPTDGRLVNVVVSPQLARAAGARGVLPVAVLDTQVLTRVVGVVRHFPTVDGNVVLADRQTVATALNAADPGPPFYNEVWVDDPDRGRLQQQLETPAMEVMSIVDRSRLADHARLSPVVRSARELLAVAVLIATLLALLGIVLAVSSDVRARRWEILDLSAQGLDRRSIIRFARARLLLACGFAALLALGLGLALASVTVRLIRIAADIEAANPPPLVTVNWPALGIGAVVVAAAAIVLVNVVAGAQVRRLEGSRT
jgi:hypothetical protein